MRGQIKFKHQQLQAVCKKTISPNIYLTYLND